VRLPIQWLQNFRLNFNDISWHQACCYAFLNCPESSVLWLFLLWSWDTDARIDSCSNLLQAL
jgi:hypothetical protein